MKYNPENAAGQYIVTYTKRKFNAFNPRPQDIVLEDIAHSLSMQCRFNGHCDYFYSVANHSILCAKVGEQLKLNDDLKLMLLFHDASEAYLADIPSPVKQHMIDYKEIENNVQEAIWDALGVRPTKLNLKTIKEIDRTLLLNEIKYLRGEEHYRELSFSDASIDLGYIEPQDPKTAKFEFIKMAIELGCKMGRGV